MILPEVIDWTGRGEYPTDDGIYANVDNEIYQGDRTRLSKHQLALIARSIGHWWAWLTDETEQTAPMRWGSAYHVAMEGGVDLFKRFYAPGPDVAKNTKAWKDALRGTPDNVVLLKSKEYASILLAAQTIRDHPIAGPIVNSPTLIKELTINYRITFPDCEIPDALQARWLRHANVDHTGLQTHRGRTQRTVPQGGGQVWLRHAGLPLYGCSEGRGASREPVRVHLRGAQTAIRRDALLAGRRIQEARRAQNIRRFGEMARVQIERQTGPSRSMRMTAFTKSARPDGRTTSGKV